MIVSLEQNNIFVTNDKKSPCLRACLSFEKVYDMVDKNREEGILPIFSIYVMNIENSEEWKTDYKEYYKQLINLLSTFPSFSEVYYINYFDEGQTIYCIKEALLETNQITKVPYQTNLRLCD